MQTPTLYFIQFNPRGTIVPFDARLLKNTGQGMVSTSTDMFNDGIYLHIPSITSSIKKTVSIVICTYGRPESLNETLTSLCQQTYKDFEVILITEKGDLSKLRDTGLRCARGDIVSFIDDDVYCPSTWLEGVVTSFRKGVIGVSGPTKIPTEYKSNRDIFKYKWFKNLHDKLFLQGKANCPGYLSSSGTPSLASCFDTACYEGEVSYLEACNMAVNRREAIEVGGFDLNFIGTSEWCEVDLALKLREKGTLLYSQKALLEHRPSKAGVYVSRLKTKHRYENFIYFQKKWEGKWIQKGFITYGYRAWVWIYLTLKNIKMI